MNIFLVTINDIEIIDVIKANIKTFPRYYFLSDDKCLVLSSLVKSRDVFNKIVGDDPAKNVIVFSIGKEVENSYWGFANGDLWTWLKNID